MTDQYSMNLTALEFKHFLKNLTKSTEINDATNINDNNNTISDIQHTTGTIRK